MSDASLQQLSRDRDRIVEEKAGEFEDRHGTGKRLTSACLAGRINNFSAEKDN